MFNEWSHPEMSRLPISTITDEQLVTQVLAGNTASFKEIIKRTEGLVTQLIYRIVGNAADRSDLTQDVYLKVFKNLSTFKFEAKLSTWVGQITYNTCLNYLKKKKRGFISLIDLEAAEQASEHQVIRYSLGSDLENDSSANLVNEDLVGILESVIVQLPSIYQTLISLYHHQELSYEEIVQITSLPIGTVKSYLFRARKMLKQKISYRYRREEL